MAQRASATTLASELWPDELACLTDLIRSAGLKGKHLEIGTAAGGTLCEMKHCFELAGRPPFVVVDPMAYFANQIEVVRRNLREHEIDPATVDLRVARSADAFRQAEAAGESFDFIFIDGAHKICYVTQDLCWTRLLNVGGFVCLHDYNSRHKGVVWPADRYLQKHLNYSREALVSNLLILKSNAPSRALEISRGDQLWALGMSPLLQLELSLAKRLRKAA